ncbi:MAG: exodeoxyribonuclease VII small subunit [Cetobacterium sp.]|uniref:exodeoxyribonuclease VII small subunit n=1 Tax=Cetobacterium TaxID=180162 RepID=UPI001F0638EC|nr:MULTISPECIES: exodeoxyribonuclease VII small subunit [Cetobacterium]MCX3068320.1 exodeoxyribonuclease VII small subunit [Cetobacterium somerae]UPO96999.1 exodeoxyribonuclease VII small subunit [Cetobacterium somerae]
MKKDSFEYNINEIDIIIEKLDKGELSLDESIKEYEKAMKLLKKSSDILNKAEGKIIKVTSENDNIQLEVDENA